MGVISLEIILIMCVCVSVYMCVCVSLYLCVSDYFRLSSGYVG